MGANHADFAGGQDHSNWLDHPDDYVTLHGGLAHGFEGLPTSPEDFDKLGMHWTTASKVAGHFAVRDYGAWHILTAKVHKNDIIPRGSSEWHDLAQHKEIEGAYDDNPKPSDETDEKEMTVRRGAPVHVLQVTPVNYFDEEASPSLKETAGELNPRFTAPTTGSTDFESFLVDKAASRGTYLKKGNGTA